jgi:hypothetical protein
MGSVIPRGILALPSFKKKITEKYEELSVNKLNFMFSHDNHCN